jgi:hypothetical protein
MNLIHSSPHSNYKSTIFISHLRGSNKAELEIVQKDIKLKKSVILLLQEC